MSSHTTLILFITFLIITVGGIAVIVEVKQNYEQRGMTANVVEDGDSLVLINAIGYNISDESFRYSRLQVRYDGEGALNLNDTHVQLRTTSSVADLYYRNGTATRNETSGFYTNPKSS